MKIQNKCYNIIIFIGILLSQNLVAQPADTAEYVSGKLDIELESGKKLPASHLKIVIMDTNRTEQLFKTITASDGFYFVDSVPFGEYILEAWNDSTRVFEQRLDVQQPQMIQSEDISIPAVNLKEE